MDDMWYFWTQSLWSDSLDFTNEHFTTIKQLISKAYLIKFYIEKQNRGQWILLSMEIDESFYHLGILPSTVNFKRNVNIEWAGKVELNFLPGYRYIHRNETIFLIKAWKNRYA